MNKLTTGETINKLTTGEMLKTNELEGSYGKQWLPSLTTFG